MLDLVGLGGVSQIQENDFSHLIHGLVEKYRSVDSHLSQFFADVGQRIYHWLNTSLAVGRAEGDEWEGRDGGGGDGDGDGDGDDGHDDNGHDNGGGDEWEGDDRREGFAMRSGGVPDGAEVASGGGYDDQMGGAGRVDPNDIMGLKRDANRGLVSGDQQLKWERNQYLDDDGDGGDGGGGGAGSGNGMYVNRSNKVKIFRDENDHYQMKQKKVGVANSYVVPVTQGTTNPILRNTLTRIINIDSQFRQTAFPYTFDPL